MSSRNKSTPVSSLNSDPGHLTRLKTLLAKIRHFENLPSDIREEIAVAATLRHFDAGQIIYLEGEPADAVYLLESGWVKAVRMSREGREQALLFLRDGEVFGDVAAFTGTAYPGTAIALEPVDVWVIPAKNLLDLTAQHSELAMAFIRHMGERVLYYVGLVEDIALRSVEARLANTLLRNAEQHDGILIVPRRSWTTFDEMAVRLGTVRDVLSRALHNLEREKLLEVGRHEIILLDPTGLEKRGSL